jgi:hypothetical protein
MENNIEEIMPDQQENCCSDWEEGVKHFGRVGPKELSFDNVCCLEYTHKPFRYCPWCGKIRREE